MKLNITEMIVLIAAVLRIGRESLKLSTDVADIVNKKTARRRRIIRKRKKTTTPGRGR